MTRDLQTASHERERPETSMVITGRASSLISFLSFDEVSLLTKEQREIKSLNTDILYITFYL